MSEQNRRPNFRITAARKFGDKTTYVDLAAIWVNDDGTMSIKPQSGLTFFVNHVPEADAPADNPDSDNKS